MHVYIRFGTMIAQKNCMSLILQKFPDFTSSWNEHIKEHRTIDWSVDQAYLSKLVSDLGYAPSEIGEQISEKNVNTYDFLSKFLSDLGYTASEIEEQLSYQPKDTDLWGDMIAFSHYVIDLLRVRETPSSYIQDIFAYTEYLLLQGDEDVQNAVCTCFLENILNVTPEQVDPKRFVQYLGEESRSYCRTWDAFTGVCTEGL